MYGTTWCDWTQTLLRRIHRNEIACHVNQTIYSPLPFPFLDYKRSLLLSTEAVAFHESPNPKIRVAAHGDSGASRLIRASQRGNTLSLIRRCIALLVWSPYSGAESILVRRFSRSGMCTRRPESLRLLRREAPRQRSTGDREGVSEAELSSVHLRVDGDRLVLRRTNERITIRRHSRCR